MLEELYELIIFIQKEYLEFNNKWKESNYYYEINLRKNEVCDLLNDEEMLNIIFNYREFINENNVQLVMDFQKFNSDNSRVSTRVKLKNSIEYKITNYTKSPEHGNGKIQINKCLNDLFGIRIIMEQNIEFEQVLSFVNQYDNLKCIKALRQEYKAIHVYFKQDNLHFPWELQIWNKQDEENNIISHEKHKQDYVKWERENKGGNV